LEIEGLRFCTGIIFECFYCVMKINNPKYEQKVRQSLEKHYKIIPAANS